MKFGPKPPNKDRDLGLKVGEKKENRFQKTRIIDADIRVDEGRDQGQETEWEDATDLDHDPGIKEAQEEVIEVERHQDDETEAEAVIEVVGVNVVVVTEAAIEEAAIVETAVVEVIEEIVIAVDGKQINKQATEVI